LRPTTLPHHRMCRFQRTAVEQSVGLPSPARSSTKPETRPGWATTSFGPGFVGPKSRPQLSRPAVSENHSGPSSQLSLGVFTTMTSADFPEALTLGISLGQCWFFPLAPSGSTEFSLMTVGLCVCSPARPLFPASLPVRIPTVESLSSALSVGPLRFRPSRSTTVVVIYPVRNFHPDRPSTCQAHERGLQSAGPSAHPMMGVVPNGRRKDAGSISSTRSQGDSNLGPVKGARTSVRRTVRTPHDGHCPEQQAKGKFEIAAEEVRAPISETGFGTSSPRSLSFGSNCFRAPNLNSPPDAYSYLSDSIGSKLAALTAG